MISLERRALTQIVAGSRRKAVVEVLDVVLTSDVGRQVLRTLSADEVLARNETLEEAATRWVATYLLDGDAETYPTQAERRARLL